jgi:hypothetical protein
MTIIDLLGECNYNWWPVFMFLCLFIFPADVAMFLLFAPVCTDNFDLLTWYLLKELTVWPSYLV